MHPTVRDSLAGFLGPVPSTNASGERMNIFIDYLPGYRNVGWYDRYEEDDYCLVVARVTRGPYSTSHF